MKNIINTNEIIRSFNELDAGFEFVVEGRNDKEFLLDNDSEGNGYREFLRFKLEKNYIRILSGEQLLPEEKKLRWYYENYRDVNFLVDDIANFTVKYVKSFKLILERKK